MGENPRCIVMLVDRGIMRMFAQWTDSYRTCRREKESLRRIVPKGP